MKNIVDIKHIVVPTEQDALLLENNLIKKYQPKFNIRLKDDKSFPWICVKNEPFPRVFKTRNVIKDGSSYFGPYTSVFAINTLLNIFRKEYKLRTCNYNLTDDNIKLGKYKVCLEYHIGNCYGVCENLYPHDKYIESIEEIKVILKGNISGVIKAIEKQIVEYADALDFENAHKLKEKYEALKKFQSKSTVVSSKITNVDVFGIVDDSKYAYINYLKIINGAIIQTYTLEIKKQLNETLEDLLLSAIVEIKQIIFSNAKEILVPVKPEFEIEGITYKMPKRGDKKSLLDLAQRNARYYQLEKEKRIILRKSEQSREEQILSQIQKDLRIKELPKHIECFDNSNIQGSNPVAACVVFKNAKPRKKDYRHFNIKTVTGANDFASMEEVVFRRYKRLLEENNSLPQLIIIDGGKGQLSSAVKALEKLNLRGKIAIIGIAKKLEEIYFPEDKIPLYLDKNSQTLKIIQHLRNEAHRFGITFHRQKRSNSFINSDLLDIKGVGEETIKKLIKDFKSVKNIKLQSKDKLAQSVGKAKAQLLINYFNKNSAES